MDEKLLGNLDFIKRDEEEPLQKVRTGGHCGSCPPGQGKGEGRGLGLSQQGDIL